MFCRGKPRTRRRFSLGDQVPVGLGESLSLPSHFFPKPKLFATFVNGSLAKGLSRAAALGVLSESTLFVIAFAPALVLLKRPVMMSMFSTMNPIASQNDIVALAQSLLPLFLGGGLILHWLYGGVLGTVRARLLSR